MGVFIQNISPWQPESAWLLKREFISPLQTSWKQVGNTFFHLVTESSRLIIQIKAKITQAAQELREASWEASTCAARAHTHTSTHQHTTTLAVCQGQTIRDPHLQVLQDTQPVDTLGERSLRFLHTYPDTEKQICAHFCSYDSLWAWDGACAWRSVCYFGLVHSHHKP